MDKKFTVSLSEEQYSRMNKRILELGYLRGKKISISKYCAELVDADTAQVTKESK